MNNKIYIVECYYAYEVVDSWIEYVSESIDSAFSYYTKKVRVLEGEMCIQLNEYDLDTEYKVGDSVMIYGVEKMDNNLINLVMK